MRKKSYILKEAGVLLIGALLICSSVAAMATTSEISIATTTNMKIKTPINKIGQFQSGNVLWDNWVENYSGAIAAQHEPPGTPNRLDAFPADDFIFDEDTEVFRVYWGSSYYGCNYAQGPKNYHYDWNITFFEDDGTGHQPGNVYAGPFTILDADITNSGAYINDTTQANGIWAAAFWAWLPDPVTFNADTKYWLSIYSINEIFPQTSWAYHNESLGGILLHQAVWKSEYFGTPNWTNLSDVVVYEPVDMLFALLNSDPDFEVTISKGLGITSTIKNQGLGDATNVTATITATGGLVLFGGTKTVSVGDINIGDTGTAKSFLIGIGNIAIEVQVTCFEGMTGYGNESGFLFLIFIF